MDLGLKYNRAKFPSQLTFEDGQMTSFSGLDMRYCSDDPFVMRTRGQGLHPRLNRCRTGGLVWGLYRGAHGQRLFQ
jgi:hypothetical protein